MKKRFCNVMFISILFSFSAVSAQNKVKIGIDAGYTYSALNANLSNLIDSKYENRYGFGINLGAELSICKGLFVASGISFLQKNYEFKRTGTREGQYTKYDNDFIAVPLLFGGYIINDPNQTNGIWIKVAGGMYTEYWLSMKYKGQYAVFPELQTNGYFNHRESSGKYNFKENENQFRRFGYGLQGQAQTGYAFNNFDIYAAYNHQYGLSDISKTNTDNNQKMKRNSYMISLGIAYKFK